MTNYFVTTGRVQAWKDNKESVNPISCTNITVADSYFKADTADDAVFIETITGSWAYVASMLKKNAGVAVELSELRPKGTKGTAGLIAQGVTNFTEIYSIINKQVRQGNGFKNGAVNVGLKVDHPDFLDFLNQDFPWIKKYAIIPIGHKLTPSSKVGRAIQDKLREGRLFLYKEQLAKDGEPLKINVCMGILMSNRGSCTLGHVNLGKIEKPSDLREAFLTSAIQLDDIWESSQQHKDELLNPEEDKQVGLGVIGLANMLANFNVSYEEFTTSLDKVLNEPYLISFELVSDQLAYHLFKAFEVTANFAKEKGFVRFFTVEPTANCSYKEVDCRGYTTTPEISAPTCHPETKISTRESSVTGSVDYQYPPNVEVSGVDVSHETHFKLNCLWQQLMNHTGLDHAISYNWWQEDLIDDESLQRWIDSPLKTWYYRWQTSGTTTDKSIMPGLDDYSEEFWGDDDEETKVCPINQNNDQNKCMSCGD